MSPTPAAAGHLGHKGCWWDEGAAGRVSSRLPWAPRSAELGKHSLPGLVRAEPVLPCRGPGGQGSGLETGQRREAVRAKAGRTESVRGLLGFAFRYLSSACCGPGCAEGWDAAGTPGLS